MCPLVVASARTRQALSGNHEMNGEFQTVLECFSPRCLSIAAGLHDVIMSLCPSAVVQVNVHVKTLIYRRQAGENPFCVVEPHQAVVKVHFPKGHALDDPAQRLKGNGRIRRMILDASAQVADEPVKRLIEEAVRTDWALRQAGTW